MVENLSEIRTSTVTALLEKVRQNNYGKYLLKAKIGRIRGFSGEDITFEFPVTALVGPNGSGKSSVLGVAGCAYKEIKPSVFFPKSAIGDESMAGWKVEYDIIDKVINPRQTVRRTSSFRSAKWARDEVLSRDVYFFGIERTVPAGEKTKYKKLTRSSYQHTGSLSTLSANVAKQIEHILGKDVSAFNVTDIGHDEKFFVGNNNGSRYSEFHFGAGESSIIRMVSEIENASDNSLVLIEEIENGLHPVATRRMVEYLIDVASRKSIQAVFTTHSDYALMPLPQEAIWACIDGRLRKGRLTVESLRAISGRVDKKLAIFVEDEFAKCWVDTILRERLGSDYDQLEVHAVAGDGNAVSIHKSHKANPSIKFKSLCIIDGDSSQEDSDENGVFRLPGTQPERSVFDDILVKIDNILAILTVSCQLPPESQGKVRTVVESVSRTNRDPHLIFNQIGMELGFISEVIIRGAFLSLWARQNEDYCSDLVNKVKALLD
ncbi:ATP-binding protein [Escherichia coli]|uniref:ATP-dependent nuclease n=1 Tax=Escherichia coli TaxID=562 RepID=UPI000588C165|nr:AAA family ATPase [Escherichia coli]EFA4242515.1 ATP-binding protein [Escherichia coli O36:H5]AJE56653.1 prophage protein [Escherichia coli]EFJ3710787.1 ATP-binding protein [Escherichia coli]EFJ3818551.1 ATP-binding protein [Escherichia coli]EFN2592885.1 ATP-binding protein [Escherichia coli]